MPTQYELVLQFPLPPRDVAQFDRVTRLEEELAKPSMLFEFDGYDCTAGRIEVRLFTDDPPRSLEIVRGLIPPCCGYRAGYRPADSQEALTALAV